MGAGKGRQGNRGAGGEARRLVQVSPFAAMLLDSGGKIVLANEAATRIFGVPRHELAGRQLPDMLAREDRSRLAELLAQGLEGRVVARLDRGVESGGRPDRIVEIRIAPLAGNGGRKLLAVAFEASDARRGNERLRAMERMEALGSLAFTVAHDFNNVLFVVRNYSDLLQRRLPEDHAGRAWLEEIRKASEQGARLTRRLLDFARRRRSDLPVAKLNEEVRAMEGTLRALVGESVELSVRLGKGVNAVAAGPDDIEEVLLNLAANARDAMPSGGRIIIETATAEIDQAMLARYPELRPGRHAVLAVTDTGVGIDPAVLPRIFDPFYTTKAPGEGTGLGLASVHGIVKRCGGMVTVYSEPGVGSTFKVYLPFARHAPMESRSPSPRDVAGGTETILLVEDDAGVRAVLRDTLTAAGYSVRDVAGGEEAIRLARESEEPIHLLLCDLVLPGLQGREVARAVRECRPGIRVLFMSGYPDQAARENGLALADAPLIVKPCSLAEILTALRRVLDAA